jgi:hypothetical protein
MQTLISKSGTFLVDENGTLTSFTPSMDNEATQISNVPERPDRIFALNHLEIPSGVKTIPDSFFAHYYIGFLKFPGSLTTLGDMSFAFCDIGDFTVTSNCSQIARGAFFCTSFFNGVNFPGTVLPQRQYRFYKRMFLQTVGNFNVTEKDYSDLPLEKVPLKKLQTESGSFCVDDYGILHSFSPSDENCLSEIGCDVTVLRSLVVPEGVVIIPDTVFQRITVLEKLVLPESVKMIGTGGGHTFSCCSLPDVVIPGKLGEVRIADSAFCGTSFKSLCLPNGYDAACGGFKNCKIENLLLKVKSEKEELSCSINSEFPEPIPLVVA